MCYDNPPCRWFRFNPMTGTDRCIKPRGEVCPDEIEKEVIEEDEDDDNERD